MNKKLIVQRSELIVSKEKKSFENRAKAIEKNCNIKYIWVFAQQEYSPYELCRYECSVLCLFLWIMEVNLGQSTEL